MWVEGRSGELGLLEPVGPRGGVLGWAPVACWAGAGKEKEGEGREKGMDFPIYV